MTGNELKIKIKELGLTQEDAAKKLNITRATLNNWCKQAVLSPQIVKNVKTIFDISEVDESPIAEFMEIIRSQQESIKNLSETIKNLTTK